MIEVRAAAPTFTAADWSSRLRGAPPKKPLAAGAFFLPTRRGLTDGPMRHLYDSGIGGEVEEPSRFVSDRLLDE